MRHQHAVIQPEVVSAREQNRLLKDNEDAANKDAARRITCYTKSFVLRRGGKDEYPQELTRVSDWGMKTQPTKRQREG
jgi:hypothetical protein